jgi:hypothetical protein
VRHVVTSDRALSGNHTYSGHFNFLKFSLELNIMFSSQAEQPSSGPLSVPAKLPPKFWRWKYGGRTLAD